MSEGKRRFRRATPNRLSSSTTTSSVSLSGSIPISSDVANGERTKCCSRFTNAVDGSTTNAPNS